MTAVQLAMLMLAACLTGLLAVLGRRRRKEDYR